MADKEVQFKITGTPGPKKVIEIIKGNQDIPFLVRNSISYSKHLKVLVSSKNDVVPYFDCIHSVVSITWKE